tara:strand:- start:24605 stop:26128 length:1524 start_codon:yes stop_codon:yes gene_type:complete
MSLTLLKSPGNQNLLKNPVVYELSSNNTLSTVGTAVNQTIELNAIPSNGDTLRLQWLNGARDITFTFTNSPDDSGLQLDRSGAHANVAAYINNLLISELESNYLINKDFELSYNDVNKILFIAREPGTAYAFTLSKTGVYNPTLDVFQSGVDSVSRPNFRVISELEARYLGDAEWEKVELELLPIEEKVLFDFSSVLKSFDKLILPLLSSSTPLNCSAQVVEFKARFGEAFGTTLAIQRMAQQATIYGVFGGLSLKDRLGFSFESAILPEFLSHRNSTVIREGQPYFVSFWNDSTNRSPATIKAALTYTDGSTATKNLYTQAMTAYQLFCMPVSHTLLSSVADAGKTVSRARIYIDGLNTGVTLNVDRKPVKAETYIAYRNGFGVIETECFTGEVLKTFETEADKAELWKRFDANYQEARQISYNNRQTYGLEINSGFFSVDRAELLGDLLSSDRHYLVLNNKYLPVFLEADSFEVKQTQRGSFNSFRLSLLFLTDNNYSDVGDRIG